MKPANDQPMNSLQSLQPRFANRIKVSLKCLIIMAAASIAHEMKGQDIVYPSGVINPFLSPDHTPQANAYNSLNALTQTNERNRLIDSTIKAGRVQTIPDNADPLWNCNNWTKLQVVNSYEDMKEGVYASDKLMYNGYKGFVLQEIYINGGTLADAGKNGLPMFALTLNDAVTLKDGHIMNLEFSGNNIIDQADRNPIESRSGATQVQPGEENIPINCESAVIYYPYLFKNSSHEKNFGMFPILGFKIVNGNYLLTYNVNEDPKYNTRMRVITQRENDNPVINIKNADDPDSLVATLTDENLKTVWYQVDGGDTLSLMDAVVQLVTEKKVAIRMNLPPGMHQITLGADDYFNLVTDTTLQREISAPSGTSPAPETEILQVYPNPVKDRLYLRYKPGNHTSVSRKLYDAQGILRYQDQIELSGKIICPIDMAGLPPGAYLLYQEIGKETRVMKVIRD